MNWIPLYIVLSTSKDKGFLHPHPPSTLSSISFLQNQIKSVLLEITFLTKIPIYKLNDLLVHKLF